MKDKKNTYCQWVYDSIDDKWDTECGEAFVVNEGTPHDNKMWYCYHCGKKTFLVIPDENTDEDCDDVDD